MDETKRRSTRTGGLALQMHTRIANSRAMHGNGSVRFAAARNSQPTGCRPHHSTSARHALHSFAQGKLRLFDASRSTVLDEDAALFALSGSRLWRKDTFESPPLEREGLCRNAVAEHGCFVMSDKASCSSHSELFFSEITFKHAARATFLKLINSSRRFFIFFVLPNDERGV